MTRSSRERERKLELISSSHVGLTCRVPAALSALEAGIPISASHLSGNALYGRPDYPTRHSSVHSARNAAIVRCLLLRQCAFRVQLILGLMVDGLDPTSVAVGAAILPLVWVGSKVLGSLRNHAHRDKSVRGLKV